MGIWQVTLFHTGNVSRGARRLLEAVIYITLSEDTNLTPCYFVVPNVQNDTDLQSEQEYSLKMSRVTLGIAFRAPSLLDIIMDHYLELYISLTEKDG